jgi:hypothetical protein
VVCPYYTMFPLHFPLRALKSARSASWVFDPFCGRGTTLYAARLLRLPAVGMDSNPVAVAIAAAKLVLTTPDEVVLLAESILRDSNRIIDLPDGDFWQWCYHPRTLIEICQLRGYLNSRHLDHSGIALRAVTLGLLHGPRTKGAPSYLSNQMPRTYATKPDAAVEFWEKRDLRPRRVDTLELIRRRAHYLLQVIPTGVRGHVFQGDARTAPLRYRRKFTHVITSPPYLGMRCYVSDQWLRNWFLGGEEDVTYDESHQMGSSSPEAFMLQLANVWNRMASICVKGAKLIARFGAIPSLKQDPAELLKLSLLRSCAAWKVTTIRRVPPVPFARRQANQFAPKLRPALKEVDVYARLEA